MTESRELSFRSNETELVYQKVLENTAESSEGSFTGVRENDLLTAVLGTLEHTSRVQGVSSRSS